MLKIILVLFIFFIGITNAYGQEVQEKKNWEDFFNNGISISFDTPEKYIDEITTNLASGSTVVDLGLYVIGMVVYAIFVWNFYRFIARREIIKINFEKYNRDDRVSPLKVAAYVGSYVFLFPIIIYVWFLVYSMFMFILAKDMPMGVVLLIAISVIASTRITSYYKEDLAKDVGKLLPFALLGVFLTSSAFFSDTTNFFSVEDIEKRFQEFPFFVGRVIEFIILVVVLEWSLRVVFLIKRRIFPAVEEKVEEKIEEQIDKKIKVHVEKIQEKQKDIEEKIEEGDAEIEEKLEIVEEKIEEGDAEKQENNLKINESIISKSTEASKGDTLEIVEQLIKSGIGDLGRLEHIRNTIQNGKVLFQSDKKYLEDITKMKKD
ncbi:MAG: hypothetical protein DWQ18_02115 [Crenarchaeota archaeon]|nr:MAG: hypothetical protein DWQ17_06415 [Thermoproteota archaeon]RDJ33739.1 MAG: hypothetical protein DWQ18_02115 [Thermoproteota archaeon]RDJ37150.1 MAG: hypothetical protein DWQ13_08505 [Thermoproteota archaeon]RDJ37317.1 MAG: hypothetical protein DWQ19_02325 [Thermoproteota archaeon]